MQLLCWTTCAWVTVRSCFLTVYGMGIFLKRGFVDVLPKGTSSCKKGRCLRVRGAKVCSQPQGSWPAEQSALFRCSGLTT